MHVNGTISKLFSITSSIPWLIKFLKNISDAKKYASVVTNVLEQKKDSKEKELSLSYVEIYYEAMMNKTEDHSP